MLIIKLKKCIFHRDLSIRETANEMSCSYLHLQRILKGQCRITERFEYKIKRFCEILDEPEKENR